MNADQEIITTSKSDSKLSEISPINSLEFGGAIRLNYAWKNYDNQQKDKFGDFGFELFRIDVNGKYGNLGLSVQQRWYSNFNAVHHAYFSFNISEALDLHLGINQVPFGILPYASHSFWFGATYYLGFEDDYDTGLKLLYKNNAWDFQAAFYKNSEYVNSARYGRYSFDLVTSDDQQNEEVNQLNIRLAHDIKLANSLTLNMGTSIEVGQIYNQATETLGNRNASALHLDLSNESWNFQVQYINYNFYPKNPTGIDEETIQFGAFMYPFMVSSRGDVYSINLARTWSINKLFIDSIRLYSDYSIVLPKYKDGSKSTQHVLGMLLVNKGLYTYIDWIMGQNMWFSGGPGIGLNADNIISKHSRLNINFGFYF